MKLFVLNIILCFGLPFLTYSQKNNKTKINSIEGFLFYNQVRNGEDPENNLSENIIDNNEFLLFNVIIGEGRAKGTSRNTLIIVEIMSDPSESRADGYIRLKATNDDNKLMLNQTQYYSIFEGDHKFKAPFLVNGTGCAGITLKAELLDNSKTKIISSMKKFILFECGE